LIPYVIICKSCSAKLKVSVPELVGQAIDCPKCSTELTLTPPTGYKNPLVDAAPTNEVTTNSFDDLDDLLGEAKDPSVPKELPNLKETAAVRSTTTHQRSKKKPAAKPIKESLVSAAPSNAHEQRSLVSPEPKQKRATETLNAPILPDGSWDSDALKKRKRLLKFGALGVLGVVLALVGVSFFASGSDTSPKSRLLDESDIPQTASVTDWDDGDVASVRSAADFAAPAIANSGFGAPTEKQPVTPLPSQPPAGELKTTAAMPNAKQPSLPPAENAADPEVNGGDSFVKETPKESPLVPSRRSLSEFARALEDAGTVLSEIKDQALLQRDSALIGLPKYFVEPLDEDSVDVAKQLAVSVSGVQFTDSPILDVLFELESLSGLPIYFDWEAGEVRATDFSQKISLTTKDEDFESLFATIADKVKLKVVASDQGLTLTRGQPPVVADHSWKLVPPLSDASVAELKNFIVRTWPLAITDDEADAAAALKELEEAVSVTSDQVTLSCDTDMHARLDELIAGMTVAAKPESGQLTMADAATTPTVFRVDSILDRPLELAKDNPVRRPYRIGSLLRRIRQQAGLNIFMDWPSFAALGWTPNTRIPGDFNESTCRDALEQLARSLKASWIVIDEKTVLLTSFETTHAKSETEVYPVKFLLQKNLTAGELKRVLEDTLRQQLQLPNVSVVYFGEYDCLIAHAPQSVHRQLYSILNRLWEDLR